MGAENLRIDFLFGPKTFAMHTRYGAFQSASESGRTNLLNTSYEHLLLYNSRRSSENPKSPPMKVHTNRRPRHFIRLACMILCAANLTATAPHALAQKKSEVVPGVESFTADTLPSWMMLDMELRSRTEAQTAIDFTSGNAQLYDLTRIRGGLGLYAPKYLSAYIQFHDDHALGLPLLLTAANMRDTFDIRQAYLIFKIEPAAVIAGRQELRFGGERLIGISNWANVSRTYDAIDARMGSDKNRVDLFSGSVVTINPTSLDRSSGGFTLHGAYGTLTTLIPKIRLEPYVLLRTPHITSQQGTKGREVLVAPGGRVVGKLPVGFDYTLEGVLERGSYSNDSIHAGAGYVKVGYTASSLPLSPHLVPEYDYATGNSHRNPQRIGTFYQFYPSNHNVFGLIDKFGWQNIRQNRLSLDMHPAKNLTVLFQGEFLQVANKNDAVYNSGGGVLIGPPIGGFRSDNIGSEFDASMQYAGHYHLKYEAGVGHLWPGALMGANKNGAALTLSYFQVSYKFKISRRN